MSLLSGLLLTSAPLSLAGATAATPQSDSARRLEGKTAPERVLEVLRNIETTLVSSRYSAVTRVDARLGLYEFDCSGMASWVLRRAAPGAAQTVQQRSPTGRPVARDFFRVIAQVRPERPTWSWQRVPRVAEIVPGDVIAWLKPPGWRSQVTGHIGFALEAPVPSRAYPGAFLVRFADASRYQHQDDTRAESGRDGFGFGTLLLIPHPETGVPVAYGWRGDHSGWLSETEVVIGRPRR